MSPVPCSSTLKSSITGDFSGFRILQVPSPLIVCFSPGQLAEGAYEIQDDIHSRKAAAKLMQTFPSQDPLPTFFTFPGILAVSSSSSRWTIPFWSRNPTIIFGTPSKNDCAQNLSSFRSYLSMSRSLRISAEVLSSTQWMGSSLRSGLQSQTVATGVSEYVYIGWA